MRVSEALQLRFKDVQADGPLIHKTKFGKSRQLPLHTSTFAELEKYLHARRLLYSESDRLFLESPDRGSVNPTPLGGGQYCAGA